MAADISVIRKNLFRVSTDIKQGQLISAATGVRDAARLMARGRLLKAEHEEFTEQLKNAMALLSYNKEIRTVFPLALTYAPGREAVLADTLDQLIEALQQSSTEEAVRKHAERKRDGLAKGREELRQGQHEEARRTFNELTAEYEEDGQLATAVGESYLHVGLYADATSHLTRAARILTDSPNVFNRLGVALRKLKDFPSSEGYFKQALELDPEDPNLHFNMGRLYLDWEKWDAAVSSARRSLELAPDFTEARQLADYAQKRLP